MHNKASMPDLPPHKEFAHRSNADGSFDAICLGCFRTVGTTATQPELQPFEDRHVCDWRLSVPMISRDDISKPSPEALDME